MSVRAKFRVTEKVEFEAGGGKSGFHVKLAPVYGDSPENKAFFDATPGGTIEMQVVHPGGAGQFPINAEFYVDFTQATKSGE